MATRGLPAWPWANAEVVALPPAEGLLLEAIRRWNTAVRDGTQPLLAMRPPLIAEDAGEAALPLDRLLSATTVSGFPAIGCVLCPRTTKDEAKLLLAMALAQSGCRSQALGLLLRHLSPTVAYAMMPTVLQLGAALRSAGILLTNPLRWP